MINLVKEQLIKDIQDAQYHLNKLLFQYIQYLMTFIPDKDLLTIYEERPDIFCKASKLSEEEILKDYNLLKLAIMKLEDWTNKNYNTPIDFVIK